MRLTTAAKYLTILSGLVIFSANAFSDSLNVLGIDDIYAAGHSTVPATIYPGTFPPTVNILAGPNQQLTFSSVTGMVGCNFSITNGPDGTCFPGVNTTVTSYAGLSGISVKQANMFLVGVFLNDNEPSGAGPAVLTYNYGGGLNTTDGTFSPDIDQVFFIGDGLTGTGSGLQQVFDVPSDATRFALGFADSFDSVPSYYADDVGSLEATFAFTTVPEPEPVSLVTGGLLLLAALYRRKRHPR